MSDKIKDWYAIGTDKRHIILRTADDTQTTVIRLTKKRARSMIFHLKQAIQLVQNWEKTNGEVDLTERPASEREGRSSNGTTE